MKNWFLLTWLVLWLPAAHAGAAEPTVQGVLSCMKANVPDALRVQDIELATTDRSGALTARLEGRLYAQREAVDAGGDKRIRAMLRIDAPTTFAGAAYLVRQNEVASEDGTFVYLPSLRRVRRVSGAFSDATLLGTNFSYSDFRRLQNSFGAASVTLEGAGTLNGRQVSVLSFVPGAEERGTYGRVRAWIDRDTCMPLKMDLYDDGAVRRRLTVPPAAIQKAGRQYYLSLAQMDDFPAGTRTVMRVLKVTLDPPVPRGFFDPATFWK